MEQLKRRLGDPKIDRGRMREYLIRLAYVEMLGQDAQFGHVHAVKLCSDADLKTKGVAYLATSLFIDNESELIFLVVNTIQTDLQSDNSLVCCLALQLVCRLVNPDVAPVLVPRVVELLGHAAEAVRKKAVIALHRCFQQAPSVVEGFDTHLRKMLCDKDPSVMGATLSAFGEAVKASPDDYRNLVGSFVSILDQIIEGKLPRSYDYHKAPAPFLQIKILKILARLGQGEKAASEQIYEVVAKCLRVANTGSTIGNAVVYECVRTASAIFPNAHLLAASADVVAHFLRQPNNNLRYAAIDALGHIVRVNSQYAQEHQMAVIDCLEDPDASLRKKTLELLQKMTTGDNVEVVVDKMVAFLEQARDDAIREDVVGRISEVAERFAPDNEWFVETMTTVFRLGGDVVRPEAVQNFLGLMAEGTGDGDASADSELRASAASAFLDLLAEEKPLHDPLLVVMAWVLGEYGTLCATPAETVDALTEIGSRRNASVATMCTALSAIGRTCCQSGASLTTRGNEWLVQMAGHVDHAVSTRAVEAQELLLSPDELRRAVAQPNAANETLDFAGLGGLLDAHVQEALNAGATPYIAAEIRRGPQEAKAEASTSLKFEAYEAYEPQAVGAAAASGFGAGGLPDLAALTGGAAVGGGGLGGGAPGAGPGRAGRACFGGRGQACPAFSIAGTHPEPEGAEEMGRPGPGPGCPRTGARADPCRRGARGGARGYGGEHCGVRSRAWPRRSPGGRARAASRAHGEADSGAVLVRWRRGAPRAAVHDHAAGGPATTGGRPPRPWGRRRRRRTQRGAGLSRFVGRHDRGGFPAGRPAGRPADRFTACSASGGGLQPGRAVFRADGATDAPGGHGAPRDGAARHGAPRDGAARYDAARDGAARHDAARDGAARHDAARDGAARHGAARDGAARHDGHGRSAASAGGASARPGRPARRGAGPPRRRRPAGRAAARGRPRGPLR